MRRRINLTIDTGLAARAKRVAHQQKISISRLVEKGLQHLTEEPEHERKSFADRWGGKLSLAPRESTDQRREHLWRKYGLSEDAHSH